MKLGTDVVVHLIYPKPPGFVIAKHEYVTRPVGASLSSAARDQNLARVV